MSDVFNLSWSNWGVQLTEVEELSLTGGQGGWSVRQEGDYTILTIDGVDSVLLPTVTVTP